MPSAQSWRSHFVYELCDRDAWAAVEYRLRVSQPSPPRYISGLTNSTPTPMYDQQSSPFHCIQRLIDSQTNWSIRSWKAEQSSACISCRLLYFIRKTFLPRPLNTWQRRGALPDFCWQDTQYFLVLTESVGLVMEVRSPFFANGSFLFFAGPSVSEVSTCEVACSSRNRRSEMNCYGCLWTVLSSHGTYESNKCSVTTSWLRSELSEGGSVEHQAAKYLSYVTASVKRDYVTVEISALITVNDNKCADKPLNLNITPFTGDISNTLTVHLFILWRTLCLHYSVPFIVPHGTAAHTGFPGCRIKLPCSVKRTLYHAALFCRQPSRDAPAQVVGRPNVREDSPTVPPESALSASPLPP